MKYGELKRTEIEKLDKTNKVVVLPLGSLEQHGRHLPLLTDSLIGGAFTFLMTASQMHSWCHLHPEFYATPVRLNGINHSRAPFVRLWLYPSSVATAKEVALERPILLKTRDLGIAINTQPSMNPSGAGPSRQPTPRVPLLGMLALRQNRLRLFVDAWRSRFSLYQGRIWPWQGVTGG